MTFQLFFVFTPKSVGRVASFLTWKKKLKRQFEQFRNWLYSNQFNAYYLTSSILSPCLAFPFLLIFLILLVVVVVFNSICKNFLSCSLVIIGTSNLFTTSSPQATSLVTPSPVVTPIQSVTPSADIGSSSTSSDCAIRASSERLKAAVEEAKIESKR